MKKKVVKSRRKKSSSLPTLKIFRITIFFVVILLVVDMVSLVAQKFAVQQYATTLSLAPIDQSFFNRKDILYSSEIGSWPMINGHYDGQYMLNYNNSCPGCAQLAKNADIPVVRWAVWNTFTDQKNPSGSFGDMTATQFNNVVDGIRGTLGAYPFIKLQPIQSGNGGNLYCPDKWGYDNLVAMDEEIIKTAGNRVQLYELSNEPDLDCNWSPAVAGTNMGNYWNYAVPKLKSYARSLGFEVYFGGPTTTTSNISTQTDTLDLQKIHDFLQTIRTEYNSTASANYHNPDLIPSFVSFHVYGIEFKNMTGQSELNGIPYYANFIDAGSSTPSVMYYINSIWGDVTQNIKIVNSEYNVDAENWTISDSDASTWYTNYLQMLRSKDVFMANQFLMASNGNKMDMITEQGGTQPYYNSFKTASLTDPLAIQTRNSLFGTPTPMATPTPTMRPTSTPTLKPTSTPTPKPTSKPKPTPTPKDITPPSVSITAPLNGSIVTHGSTVKITATATDNVGVTKVKFLVNGSQECSDSSSPYSCSWDVPNKKNVTYTLTATASDAAGNVSLSSITVTSK